MQLYNVNYKVVQLLLTILIQISCTGQIQPYWMWMQIYHYIWFFGKELHNKYLISRSKYMGLFNRTLFPCILVCCHVLLECNQQWKRPCLSDIRLMIMVWYQTKIAWYQTNNVWYQTKNLGNLTKINIYIQTQAFELRNLSFFRVTS